MPIPSKTWFPTNLQAQAAWFQNFVTNLPLGLATNLGFSAAEHTAILADNEDFQSIAATQLALDNFATAYRQYRISVCEDPVGTPQPMFPSENFVPPPNDVPAGIFQRLIENVDRIRAAPIYTDELGANLGIKPAQKPIEPEGELKPVLNPETSPGNVVNVKFVKGQTDGIVIEMQIDIETQWSAAGTFVKSPAVLNIPTIEGNLPRAVRLRGRYLSGNNQVGLNSDTVNVVTIP